MIHPDYSRHKHDPRVRRAAAALRAVYCQGVKHVEAERALNAAVEECIAPKRST